MGTFKMVHMVCSRGEQDIDCIDMEYGDHIESLLDAYVSAYGYESEYVNGDGRYAHGLMITSDETYTIVIPEYSKWFKIFERDELTSNQYKQWIELCDQALARGVE